MTRIQQFETRDAGYRVFGYRSNVLAFTDQLIKVNRGHAGSALGNPSCVGGGAVRSLQPVGPATPDQRALGWEHPSSADVAAGIAHQGRGHHPAHVGCRPARAERGSARVRCHDLADLLAEIAMTDPAVSSDPALAHNEMNGLLLTYREPRGPGAVAYQDRLDAEKARVHTGCIASARWAVG
jgi:hypothetical protein